MELAIYIEAQQTDMIPSKEEGYFFNEEESFCNNGASIEWDYISWSPIIRQINITRTSCNLFFSKELVPKGSQYKFNYIGSSQTLTIPSEGYYQIELWGAGGGYGYYAEGATGPNKFGGRGGYAKATFFLKRQTVLYLEVGGKGQQYAGGYNGGGSGAYSRPIEYSGGGGGASHVAFSKGLLNAFEQKKEDILLVAGGGGGGSTCAGNGPVRIIAGGFGGGVTGGNNYGNTAIGATQEKAGYILSGHGRSGSFGQGGNGVKSNTPSCETEGGGGGGYYGGAASSTSGSGGSGYFSSFAFDSLLLAGNESIPAIDNSEEMTGNEGNGYAKITYLGVFLS